MIVTPNRAFQRHRANQLLRGQIDACITLAFFTLYGGGVRFDFLLLLVDARAYGTLSNLQRIAPLQVVLFG
ncbi:hypothetical protein ACV355_29810, partial [Pseudomonas aeruginosa]